MPIWKRYRYVFLVVTGLLVLGLIASSFLLLGHTNSRNLVTKQVETSQSGTPAQVATTTAITTGTHKPTPTLTPVPSIQGTRLSIPSVGINAPIENVGLASDGTLAVPAQQPWTDVGWYQYGPYPGSKGSAVIDGHLDRPGGSPAVFWTLKNIHIGDIVTVTNARGQAWHFRVTAMKEYTPSSAPVSAIFGSTGGTFLNLITCAGTWIPAQHQTTLRLVVYTTLV